MLRHFKKPNFKVNTNFKNCQILIALRIIIEYTVILCILILISFYFIFLNDAKRQL